MTQYQRILAGESIETVLGEEEGLLDKLSNTFNSIRNFSFGGGALAKSARTGNSTTPAPATPQPASSYQDMIKGAQAHADRQKSTSAPSPTKPAPATSATSPASKPMESMTDAELVNSAWTTVRTAGTEILALYEPAVRELGRRHMAREAALPSFALSKTASLTKTLRNSAGSSASLKTPKSAMPSLKSESDEIIAGIVAGRRVDEIIRKVQRG